MRINKLLKCRITLKVCKNDIAIFNHQTLSSVKTKTKQRGLMEFLFLIAILFTVHCIFTILGCFAAICLLYTVYLPY